jgi:hypothetical protein
LVITLLAALPSTTMIGDVYGHLLPDSEDYLRGLLDSYDAVRGLSVDHTDAAACKSLANQ